MVTTTFSRPESHIYSHFKTIISQALSTIKYTPFNSLNFPEHLHIRHPEEIIIKILIIYFTISQVPVCLEIPSYTSHTIHIITPPDIVTGWHSVCLIYISCTIQVLIKQEQRSPHSWSHYINFQKGAAPLSSPLQSDHWALSLARGPGTLPRNLCGLLDTSRGHSKPLGWRPSPPLTHIPLTAWQIQPLVPVSTQSLDKWNIIIFYILNRSPTAWQCVSRMTRWNQWRTRWAREPWLIAPPLPTPHLTGSTISPPPPTLRS